MLLRHLRQHIVRRSVDNAHNLRNFVRRKTFLQRFNDRNSTANTCLIEEINGIFICSGIELAQMLRDDILIRRNNMLSCGHRTQHIVPRRRKAAHNLDDNRNLLIVENFIKIIC